MIEVFTGPSFHDGSGSSAASAGIVTPLNARRSVSATATLEIDFLEDILRYLRVRRSLPAEPRRAAPRVECVR